MGSRWPIFPVKAMFSGIYQMGNQLGMSVMSAFWLKSFEDISVQGIFWAKKFFRTMLRQNTCEHFHIVSARSNWPEVHWAETSMGKFHHVSWVTKPYDLWKEWVNRPMIYCIREDSHSKIICPFVFLTQHSQPHSKELFTMSNSRTASFMATLN